MLHRSSKKSWAAYRRLTVFCNSVTKCAPMFPYTTLLHNGTAWYITTCITLGSKIAPCVLNFKISPTAHIAPQVETLELAHIPINQSLKDIPKIDYIHPQYNNIVYVLINNGHIRTYIFMYLWKIWKYKSTLYTYNM